MSNSKGSNGSNENSLTLILLVIYGLHGFSAVSGLLTPAFIVTAFLTGWPSILAVLLSYLKKHEADGSYLYSHFEFVIRTFWFALLWLCVGGVLMLTLIGIPAGFLVIAVTGIWVLYRLAKGILNLLDEQPVE